MSNPEIASLITILGGILTAFGAGNVVPTVGPAIQGILAIVTFAAAIYSWWQHRANRVSGTVQ